MPLAPSLRPGWLNASSCAVGHPSCRAFKSDCTRRRPQPLVLPQARPDPPCVDYGAPHSPHRTAEIRPLLPEHYAVNAAAPKACVSPFPPDGASQLHLSLTSVGALSVLAGRPAFAAWRGGALLAGNAAASASLWISRAAWEEEGTDRVLARCGRGSLGQWAPLPASAMDEEEG